MADELTNEWKRRNWGRTNLDVKGLEDLEAFFSMTQSIGSYDKALTNNLYGINHRGVKGLLPENRDSYGYVFFTRPALNLSNSNLRNIRKFYSLLTTKTNSIHRYVRCTLDPRLHVTTGSESLFKDNKEYLEKAKKDPLISRLMQTRLDCNMLDHEQGFIPVLTNLITKCDGFPDVVIPTFTSKEGVRREQWSIADGSTDIYEVWDMNTSFKNIKDEPLIVMFETWTKYMALAYEGMVSPYWDFILENEIDYMSRVYRIILDESKLFVKKIAATGASFPINVPNGQFFDFDTTVKYNDSTKEIPIRWRCHGVDYNDDILVKEFNQVNCIFNMEYRKYVYGDKSSKMVPIPFNMLQYFNNRGYPYINPDTLELQWLINTSSKTYKNVLRYFKYTYQKDSSNHTMVWKMDPSNWNARDIKRRVAYKNS